VLFYGNKNTNKMWKGVLWEKFSSCLVWGRLLAGPRFVCFPYYLDFLKVNKLITMYDVNKVRTIHFYTKVHFLALLFMTCTIRTSSHSTFHIVVCSTVNLKHELDRSVTVTNPCFIRTLKP
jgi:hypothetical protein